MTDYDANLGPYAKARTNDPAHPATPQYTSPDTIAETIARASYVPLSPAYRTTQLTRQDSPIAMEPTKPTAYMFQHYIEYTGLDPSMAPNAQARPGFYDGIGPLGEYGEPAAGGCLGSGDLGYGYPAGPAF